ncbi:MAG: zinc ribbon domain-containing protein [Ruminococcus sp.]|nr:zinc ribbon domain-containing protein [Ruminococcus sp.]
MALINCPECGNSISSFAKSCIYCGYPLDILCDNHAHDNRFSAVLKICNLPFELTKYDSTGSISEKFSISNVNYIVENECFKVTVKGRKIYQRKDIIWAQGAIKWIITPPDSNNSVGYYSYYKLNPGDYFEFSFEDLILENGVYKLDFEID